MIRVLTREVQLASAAVVYLTRLRLPVRLMEPFPAIETIAKYFPLVGTLVGSLAAAVYVLSAKVWSHDIAIFLSMAATTLATGAFHEDGFADLCDGLGGGWSKEQILTIMKDSRVGAFGAIGMVFLLLGKFLALSALPPALVVPALISTHSVSRAMGCLLAFSLPYARPIDATGEKPVMRDLQGMQIIVCVIFGVLPLVLLSNGALWRALLILPLIFGLFYAYLKRWIGGYTGDCCGALQQVSEVAMYLMIGAFRSHF